MPDPITTTTAAPMQFTRIYNNPGVPHGTLVAAVLLAIIAGVALGMWIAHHLERRALPL